MTDPTTPERWPEQQALGRETFQLRYGVLGIGIPLAIVVDVVFLLLRGDWALFVSVHHAIQLLLMSFTVGLVGGLLAGRVLWRIGERRFGDMLLMREFLGDRDGKADPSSPRSSG